MIHAKPKQRAQVPTVNSLAKTKDPFDGDRPRRGLMFLGLLLQNSMLKGCQSMKKLLPQINAKKISNEIPINVNDKGKSKLMLLPL